MVRILFSLFVLLMIGCSFAQPPPDCRKRQPPQCAALEDPAERQACCYKVYKRQANFDCSTNPCQNGGTCSNNRCTCPLGYEGVFCERASCKVFKRQDRLDCSTNPCQNGGTCSNGLCTCPPGYTGDRCQNAQGC